VYQKFSVDPFHLCYRLPGPGICNCSREELTIDDARSLLLASRRANGAGVVDQLYDFIGIRVFGGGMADVFKA